MSTTLRTLLAQRACLLLTAVVMLSTSLWALQRIDRSIDGVRARTAPAILEISEARRALAAADKAAVTGFAGERQLIGSHPGEEYQHQLGIANQSLAQAAEDNSIGEEGGRILQLVEGLLVSYTGWIGQADAHFQQRDTVLGLSNLWNASRLMHRQDGILARLGDLQAMEQRGLREETSSGWWTPQATLAWTGPVVVFLVLAVASQVYLTRRFRRWVNTPLALATGVVLVGLPVVVAQAAESRRELAEARERLVEITGSRDAVVSRSSDRGQHSLAILLGGECTADCGPTLAEFVERPRDLPPEQREQSSPTQAITEGRTIDSMVGNARMNAFVTPGVGAAAVAVFVLTAWGFHLRINEYRFQPR